MKQRISALLLAVLLLTLALTPVAASANTIGTRYIKTSSGSSVRMRSGPGTEYDVLVRVPYGAMVETYSQMTNVENENWTEIGYNGTTGWIMTRYLSKSKPTTPSSQPSSGSSDSGIYNNFTDVQAYAAIRPTTTGNFVNMRWAPSKSAPVIAKYYEGQQVYVLKANKSWCQVYDAENNRSGFIMRSLLSY